MYVCKCEVKLSRIKTWMLLRAFSILYIYIYYIQYYTRPWIFYRDVRRFQSHVWMVSTHQHGEKDSKCAVKNVATAAAEVSS